MSAYLVEETPYAVCWRLLLLHRSQLDDLQFESQPHLLNVVQVLLPRLLLLDLLERDQRQTDEGVQDDDVAQEEEQHEEDLDVFVRIVGRSFPRAIEVHHLLHEVHPSFHGSDEEQTQQ